MLFAFPGRGSSDLLRYENGLQAVYLVGSVVQSIDRNFLWQGAYFRSLVDGNNLGVIGSGIDLFCLTVILVFAIAS